MTDFITTKPIYLQITETLRLEIVEGKYGNGDRLPSVRELSTEMGVNPATVLRAYDKLQEDGIIEIQRGVGYFLCDGAVEKIFDVMRSEFFSVTVPELSATLSKLKISPEQFLQHLTR